ncbi:uncharacterized protein LOC114532645 isoform X2 [Dendronephthya gigantea]|uniref:uncharacterized protein LOC114532645 isoform X2 n=1 Tax=Dendronephthya gigantea TaxID=151771 RepID=UPI00106A6D63|nr:uncharacterized protein LOC114532645 isoform X2 [Dendronephthya gigantea]
MTYFMLIRREVGKWAYCKDVISNWIYSIFIDVVLALLFLIYGFSLNIEYHVFARRTQHLAKRYPWPNATIPYMLDCSIANVVGAKAVIKAAMAAWENRTCIRFVKRTNQKGYLLIRRQKGCWGQVGYKGKMSILSMGDGCEYKYVMTHELGHVIGFYHEHQRSDRDEFVEILWDNILNSMWKQFYKRPEDDNMDTGLDYDHSSIMHYKFKAFGKNISMSTILLRDKNSTEEPTPYRYITDLDVLKTREMYNCPDVEAQKNETNTTKTNTTNTEEKNEEDIKEKLKAKNITPEFEIVEAAEVSMMSSGWYSNTGRERTASIMVNGKELARNRFGMNIVVFNYLSGRKVKSDTYSITTQRAGEVFSEHIQATPRRNYFLIVSKVPNFTYLKEARLALKNIGIRLPRNITPGSSLCIIGYKGREDVPVKFVIGSPEEKASFLSMNITLPSDYNCQNDAQRCSFWATQGRCQGRPEFYLRACQKACSSCTKGQPCQDENPKCEEWAKKRYCRSHPAYMLKYCKVSCKICRKALPARIKAKGNSSRRRRRKIVVVGDDNKIVRRIVADDNDVDEDEYDGRAIGTRCSDKSESCPFWAKAGRCKTDSWVQKNCLISCNVKGTCDRQEIKPEGTCSNSFNIGWDQKVSDNAFTASSFYVTGQWNASAENARLYMEDDFINFRIGSWCADYPPKSGEWLQIDLGRPRTITAVATQGRYRFYEHVKTFKLSYSRKGKKWKYIQENEKDKVFKGNCDHGSPVLNILNESIYARLVKFHPIKYYEGICMRVEIYGC